MRAEIEVYDIGVFEKAVEKVVQKLDRALEALYNGDIGVTIAELRVAIMICSHWLRHLELLRG